MLARIVRLEMAFVFLLTLLGGFVIIESGNLGYGKPNVPGPGFYSGVVGALIVLLGLVLLFTEAKAAGRALFPSVPDAVRFYLMVGGIAAWLLLLSDLGFIPSTFLVTFVLAKILRLRGWVRPLLLAIGTTVGVYLLFNVWFYTDLPRGILGY